MRETFYLEYLHPKGLMPATKSVGISVAPESIEKSWGYIQILHPQMVPDGKPAIVFIIERQKIADAINYIASLMKNNRIKPSWKNAKDEVIHAFKYSTSDDPAPLDEKDKEILKSQGFVLEGTIHFDPTIKRTEAPRYYEDTKKAEKKPSTAAGKVKRGDRPTLSKIVDDALLGDGASKSMLIKTASAVYPEKTEKQLLVTITSLISTSAGRHGKTVKKTGKDGEPFYKLE